MKKHIFIWLLIAAQTLALAASAQDSDAGKKSKETTPPARRIAVVVSRSNPITKLETVELERIFLREKMNWPNGEKITVYERSTEHPIREQFAKIVLRKKPAEMAEYWLNSKLTRGVDAPKVCQSATLLKRYMERVGGAIGYLYTDEVDETVKVVATLEIK